MCKTNTKKRNKTITKRCDSCRILLSEKSFNIKKPKFCNKCVHDGADIFATEHKKVTATCLKEGRGCEGTFKAYHKFGICGTCKQSESYSNALNYVNIQCGMSI